MAEYQPKYQGVVWILLAACFYSSAAILGKWVCLLHIPMAAIFSWRYAIAALIFGVLYQFQKPQGLNLKNKIKCFSIGFFGDTIRTTLFFITISRVGASLASLLLYTFPFFIFLFQRFVFQKPATRLQWLSLFLSSLGCFLAIAPWQETAIKWDRVGIATGIGTGLVQAVYILYSDSFIKEIPTLSVTTYAMRGGFAIFFLVALAKGQLTFPNHATEWILAFSLAICATAIPIFCLMKGIRLTGATHTSVLLTVEPAITAVLAFLFFAEPLTFPKILGSFLVMGSALLIQKKGLEKAFQI